ncbi:sodium:solute symporter [Bifidobacterium cebidarum]|uniref:Sodium:solute symporter n=1 Tax=Bifidobacterium cebidarum TaxID=2650773 RepID=A0A6I1GI92_9BIFI|nr:sodium:solute symporter [Bifidobacterium cebidarum]
MLDKIAGALSNGIVGFVVVAAGMVSSATAADITAANVRTFETFAFYISARVHHAESVGVHVHRENRREHA